ncbi:MAG: MmcQ/YjbR family DNA-binding protein [Streptosporangiales bacterium]|nr:MmcQ/YjbR family DNA-binding protein [Streptosporangiales bacterium]
MATVDDVCAIARALPQAVESVSYGTPVFRIRDKTFCSMSRDNSSMGVKVPRDDRPELIEAEPEKFFIQRNDEGFHWVRVRLAAIDDLDELRAILIDSWRQCAPKSLAATLDD